MKKQLLVAFMMAVTAVLNQSYAQVNPGIIWQKCLGGTGTDRCNSFKRTSDGGFIAAGSTTSIDGDVTGLHGTSAFSDFWVVKTDATGNLQWQKTIGGSNNDVANSIVETTDGGFAVCGYTYSTDGDVTGKHGNTFDKDYFVVKLSSSGIILWKKCFGGTEDDYAQQILQNADGTFMVIGTTRSSDGDVTGAPGLADVWLLNLNASGNINWKLCYGGSVFDAAYSIEPTSDGGYILSVETNSNDGQVTGFKGFEDFWIVKITSNGTLQWEKCLGGSWWDSPSTVIQTSDGGYIAVGLTESQNGDVIFDFGMSNYWIAKLDASGILQWQQTLGGTYLDVATDVVQTSDGGYLVSGRASSWDIMVSGKHGTGTATDIWLVKLDANGNFSSNVLLGGTGDDATGNKVLSDNGNYILCSSAFSNDGDVTGNHGSSDFWILKVSSTALLPRSPVIYTFFGDYSPDVCPNQIYEISCNVPTYLNAGNIFTAQLSDATGSFSNPVTIGTFSAIGSTRFNVTIPADIVSSTKFRTRVISSDPALTGTDNGYDIESHICGVPTFPKTKNIKSKKAKLCWSSANFCNTSQYGYQYRKTGSNTWTTGVSISNVTIKKLKPNTAYEWQVQRFCTVNPDVLSDFTPLQYFTTLPARLGDEEEGIEDIQFDVMPNPFSNTATASFTLSTSSFVEINMIDLNGRKIKTILSETVSEGNHQVLLTNEGLTAGMYFLQIKSQSGAITKKIIVE